MPIKQQRMIDMISAAEHCIQARDDLIAQIRASIDLHLQGITTVRETFQQIESAFGATAPAVATLILIATERKHFKDWAKRNDYTANRRAKVRAGLLAQQFTDQKEAKPKRERGPKWGMVGSSRFNPTAEQLAKAQESAFTPDANGELFDATPEDVGPPTPEQLAADEALAANLDKDEMNAHIAANRKGEQ